MVSKSDKEALVNYRIQRAYETAEDARIALDNNRLFNAQNRIYYALFYSVSALAVKSDFSTSKHTQLLGWFNRNIIHAGVLPIELGRFYKKAFENRQEGDYDDFVVFEKDDVQADYLEAIDFIKSIEKLIETSVN
ncbi:MAG: HEPN domain-containing protein [Candidatus Delongbacteria bacterium]|nr:HEPN domain-containing protein [Candidatus Delongbacteria bacterium]MBN2835425.1 HEPN domain-containing protein [Candidatus Delongbacteria bacterium]